MQNFGGRRIEREEITRIHRRSESGSSKHAAPGTSRELVTIKKKLPYRPRRHVWGTAASKVEEAHDGMAAATIVHDDYSATARAADQTDQDPDQVV